MSRIHVFNHHSLPFESRYHADGAVPEFIKMCLKAKRLGFDTILLDETQDANWFRIELARGYFFQDWYNSMGTKGADREILRAFRSIATKTPLFTSDDLDDGSTLFEVREATSNIEYSTLRAAVWFETPISSFSTRAPWNQTPVAVIITAIDEDGEHEYNQDVANWHSLAVIAEMEEALRNERDAAIYSGGDIWSKRDTLFPLLTFCGESAFQLQNIHTQTILHQVRESLCFLNLFVEKWSSGEIKHYTHDDLRSIGMAHKVSGESDTVRKDPRMRKAREFWLKSGERVFFENHIKLAAGFRIYFYPESKTRCIHIGYIGRHLRTAGNR